MDVGIEGLAIAIVVGSIAVIIVVYAVGLLVVVGIQEALVNVPFAGVVLAVAELHRGLDTLAGIAPADADVLVIAWRTVGLSGMLTAKAEITEVLGTRIAIVADKSGARHAETVGALVRHGALIVVAAIHSVESELASRLFCT